MSKRVGTNDKNDEVGELVKKICILNGGIE